VISALAVPPTQLVIVATAARSCLFAAQFIVAEITSRSGYLPRGNMAPKRTYRHILYPVSLSLSFDRMATSVWGPRTQVERQVSQSATFAITSSLLRKGVKDAGCCPEPTLSLPPLLLSKWRYLLSTSDPAPAVLSRSSTKAVVCRCLFSWLLQELMICVYKIRYVEHERLLRLCSVRSRDSRAITKGVVYLKHRHRPCDGSGIGREHIQWQCLPSKRRIQAAIHHGIGEMGIGKCST
jgi:hypothetical protein